MQYLIVNGGVLHFLMMFSAFTALQHLSACRIHRKIERIVESSNDHVAHAEICLTVNGIYLR